MNGYQRSFLLIIALVCVSLCLYFLPGYVHVGGLIPLQATPEMLLRLSVTQGTDSHSEPTRFHAQNCPEKWPSLVELYRPSSSLKPQNFTENMETMDYTKTTSPDFTTVSILNARSMYNVCDVLIVKIEARDWLNSSKGYGGDFFRLKIYENDPYSAAAEDEVIDFGNGTYLAFFTLRWAGHVKVGVKLIHPSEVIPQMALTATGKVGLNITFSGEFTSGSASEEVICRYVELPPPMCNLSNPRTHGPWYCQKPKNPDLTCKDWKYHKMYKGTFLRLEENLTPLSRSLLKKSHMIEIKNNNLVRVFNRGHVLPGSQGTAQLPYCTIDGAPQGIHAAGYFYRNKWFPDRCRVVSFNLIDGMKCLRNKRVIVLGDSTIRQVYEYFRDVYKKHFVQLPLAKGVTKIQGPLDLFSKSYNTSIQYHFHGLPSSGTGLVLKADTIEFVADRLNSKKDGCDAIYVISLWAHFITAGTEFYIARIRAIKSAIQRYLDQCPRSKVILKGANTKDHPALWIAIVSSEWNIVKMELALREIFRDERRVGFIDAFGITKVQPYEDNVHPKRPIIKEYVDRILTYICKS